MGTKLNKKATDLAATARREYRLFAASLEAALDHARLCGAAVFSAKDAVAAQDWADWLDAANLSQADADRCLKFYVDEAVGGVLSEMASVVEAHRERGLREGDEARALVASGMTKAEAGRRLGVGPHRLNALLHPEGPCAYGREVKARQDARRRQREATAQKASKALRMQENKRSSKAVTNDDLGRAYASVRVSLDALQRFLDSRPSREASSAATTAMENLYRAEDAIASATRAVAVSA